MIKDIKECYNIINFNNAATPINGYAFSVANSVTTTGTNWVVSYSNVPGWVNADGVGDISTDVELYKTRFFTVGYAVNTFTINNILNNRCIINKITFFVIYKITIV